MTRPSARSLTRNIGTALRTIEPERTPLQREIDRLVRFIAVFGLGAAAIVAPMA
jgi:Ca2+-transporting ATPase